MRNVEFKIIKNFKELYIERKGWNQHQFCIAIGYDPAQVSRYLSGQQEPSLPFLRKTCYVLRVDLRDIVSTVFNKFYQGEPNEKDNK